MIHVQPFGSTGHQSTRLLFGAAALGNVSQDEADQTMELIREHGINHIDTAASYGEAELRLCFSSVMPSTIEDAVRRLASCLPMPAERRQLRPIA